MFNNDEDNDDFLDSSLKNHIEKFEASLRSGVFSFFDSDVLELIVDHYIVNGDYTKAIKAAEYGVEYFPMNKLFVLRIAQSYSAKGLLKEALNLLSNKEIFLEYLVEYYLTKANIFSQLKNSDNAIKFFKLALNLTEQEERDEIYLDIAMEYQYKGDYRSAIETLEEAVRINTHNEVALYELAFCYDFIGDFDKAIQCYSNFLDENPYSFTAWYNLGNIYSKVEDWDSALKAYDYSNAINEEFTPVYFNMGNAYLSLDEYTKAEECFLKCLELEGDDAYAFCYLGECLEQQDKLLEAREYYNRALALNPEMADAWLGLGIVNDLEGNTEKGIPLILKAIEIDPLNASYYHVLASAYEKNKDLESADFYYIKALELNPDNFEIIKDYYVMLFNSDQWVRAYAITDKYEETIDDVLSLNLLRVHWFWKNSKKDMALGFLTLCLLENVEQSKQILEWFPELNSEPQIKNLFDNL